MRRPGGRSGKTFHPTPRWATGEQAPGFWFSARDAWLGESQSRDAWLGWLESRDERLGGAAMPEF
jgi:hypothetical protein